MDRDGPRMRMHSGRNPHALRLTVDREHRDAEAYQDGYDIAKVHHLKLLASSFQPPATISCQQRLLLVAGGW
jgi:hypothetical protein